MEMENRNPLFVVMVIVITAAWILTACSSSRPDPVIERPFAIWSGADSAIFEPRFARITTPEAWAALWCEHRGRKIRETYDSFYNPAALPDVDFDQCMVIALFTGQKGQSAGIDVVTFEDTGGELRIGYREKYYQVILEEGEKDTDFTSRPFGLLLVPASDKPVVVEEMMGNTKAGEKPTWVERARID